MAWHCPCCNRWLLFKYLLCHFGAVVNKIDTYTVNNGRVVNLKINFMELYGIDWIVGHVLWSCLLKMALFLQQTLSYVSSLFKCSRYFAPKSKAKKGNMCVSFGMCFAGRQLCVYLYFFQWLHSPNELQGLF